MKNITRVEISLNVSKKCMLEQLEKSQYILLMLLLQWVSESLILLESQM